VFSCIGTEMIEIVARVKLESSLGLLF
jgi:hypothetical protein